VTKIILLSDGTGNTPNKVWRTNVWRTFQSIDQTADDQIAYYDDGVGTSSFIPLAVIGGLFGWGLKRNVISLYKFVCRNYKSSNDEIFAFGFSRGAFTIRALLEIIASQGLVPFASQAELDWKAEAAYRAHRNERSQSIVPVERLFIWLTWMWNPLRGKKYHKEENRYDVRVRFVGLWDTVGAYGLPIEAMTRALSRWFWPLDLPTRELPKIVQRACHALALDDERKTFHPILWDEHDQPATPPDSNGMRYTKNERISQVWFAGTHANVGGGYPDDSLAHVSLCWILDEACHCGLKLKSMPSADPDAVLHAKSQRDRDGRIYDSRKGLRGFYRYAPRKLSELCQLRKNWGEVQIKVPKIHESVFKRMRASARLYAPIGIPDIYDVVSDDGRILSAQQHGFESSEQAKFRAHAQENVWDLVWQRRAVSLGIMLLVWCLILSPLFLFVPATSEFTTPLRPISDLVRLVGAFVPAGLEIWIDNYARDPLRFSILVLIIIVLYRWGAKLKVQIIDEMSLCWAGSTYQKTATKTLIYALRTSNIYKWFGSIAEGTWPTILAMSLVLFLAYLGLTAINRIAFNFEDAAGLVCTESHLSNLPELYSGEILLADGKTARLAELEDAVRNDPALSNADKQNPFKYVPNLPVFQTSALCQSLQIKLERGRTYLVRLQTLDSFYDGAVRAGGGFQVQDVPELWRKLLVLVATPMRRSLLNPWYTVVLRIGGRGAEETFLEPSQASGSATIIRERIRATRDGEMFLYVNDVVIGLPSFYDVFYKAHRGTARVLVFACDASPAPQTGFRC